MAPHGQLSVVLAMALTSTSTIVVALRLYTRHFLVGKITAADWIMLLALLSTWVSAVVNLYMVRFLEERSMKVSCVFLASNQRLTSQSLVIQKQLRE